MKPDATRIELFKLYTQCVKDQTEIKEKELNIKLVDKISAIAERVRAQPITIPTDALSAGIILRKVHVASD